MERLTRLAFGHGMVSQSVQYDENARACEEHAKNVTDASIREMWLNIAKQWRQMAETLRKHLTCSSWVVRFPQS